MISRFYAINQSILVELSNQSTTELYVLWIITVTKKMCTINTFLNFHFLQKYFLKNNFLLQKIFFLSLW